MKRRTGGTRLLAIATGVVLLAACVSEPPVKVKFPRSLNPKTHAPIVVYPKGESGGEPQAPRALHAAPAKTITVPIVKYKLPAVAPVIRGAKSRSATGLVAENTTHLVVKPESDDYRGGAVVYNWIPDQVYELFVAPLRLTDITLEPRETLESPPAAGDTSDFIVSEAHSLQGGGAVVHVLIKAIYPDKQTTLEIDTNRRTYTFAVYSYRDVYMPLVSFDYPLEAARRETDAASQAAASLPVFGEITNLDFGYKIIPHSVNLPHWMPSIVFTDGLRTYIEFASAARASYAPVLFAVSPRGKRTLVNYRVVGDYYVVDEVLVHAELVLDVNSGNIITILKVR